MPQTKDGDDAEESDDAEPTVDHFTCEDGWAYFYDLTAGLDAYITVHESGLTEVKP